MFFSRRFYSTSWSFVGLKVVSARTLVIWSGVLSFEAATMLLLGKPSKKKNYETSQIVKKGEGGSLVISNANFFLEKSLQLEGGQEISNH